jgi:IclR family transcriptional regulator, pca regulon regulatory protein
VAVRLTDRRGDIRGAIGMTLQAAFWDDARITEELVPGLQDTAALLRQIV